jgi:hypothetical protein
MLIEKRVKQNTNQYLVKQKIYLFRNLRALRV